MQYFLRARVRYHAFMSDFVHRYRTYLRIYGTRARTIDPGPIVVRGSKPVIDGVASRQAIHVLMTRSRSLSRLGGVEFERSF